MRQLGTVAAACTWVAIGRVLAAGWLAQRRADRLDARDRHARSMAALGHAVTPTEYP